MDLEHIKVKKTYELDEAMLIGLYWAIYDSGKTMTKFAILNHIIEVLGYKPR